MDSKNLQSDRENKKFTEKYGPFLIALLLLGTTALMVLADFFLK